ncbi:hypothetical protein F5X99DRAFT_377821 [Biscogniauxia marginata]|nr:hypothetical protein F5X99DRAFT_377821 [Biscogniauxia marginata]
MAPITKNNSSSNNDHFKRAVADLGAMQERANAEHAAAMAEARSRLAPLVGEHEAEMREAQRRMDELGGGVDGAGHERAMREGDERLRELDYGRGGVGGSG